MVTLQSRILDKQDKYLSISIKSVQSSVKILYKLILSDAPYKSVEKIDARAFMKS